MVIETLIGRLEGLSDLNGYRAVIVPIHERNIVEKAVEGASPIWLVEKSRRGRLRR